MKSSLWSVMVFAVVVGLCVNVNGSIDCVDNGVCVDCPDLEMVWAQKYVFSVSNLIIFCLHYRTNNIVKTPE